MVDGSLSFSLIAGLKHKLEKCVERRGPGILLNSGRLQLGSAYYFVFNYVPREPRAEYIYIYIHACVVKRRYNLIATAIRALSKCIRPRGDPFKNCPFSSPPPRYEGKVARRKNESKSADPT